MKRSASCPVPQTRQSDRGSETKKGRRSGPRSVGSKSWDIFLPAVLVWSLRTGEPGAAVGAFVLRRQKQLTAPLRSALARAGAAKASMSAGTAAAAAAMFCTIRACPGRPRMRFAARGRWVRHHSVVLAARPTWRSPPLTWASEASTRRSVPERLRGGGDALCVRSVSRTSAEASCSHGAPKSAAISSPGRPFLGSVASTPGRPGRRWRRRSCGGSGGALHVPIASMVFGYGFDGLETTESAVTTSGIPRTPKQPPSTASRNLPLQDCSRAQKVVFVRDLTLCGTPGTGLWPLACLVRRRGTLVSRSHFHTIV